MILRQLKSSALAALFLLLVGRAAESQSDAIRRARDAVRARTQSLDALFGKEPPLTTSIEDAKDGVPSLDGFEPEWYSPLAEMPWGQDGTLLLVPGTYVLMSEAYCLRPGTLGPQTGDGYLNTEWKGPQAEYIKRVLLRRRENQDLPQQQVQLLLWAILARADVTKLKPETQAAANRLLTSAERRELSGYTLGVVPDEVRDRVLQSVPPSVRQVLDAENRMRRLFGSAESEYADMERVAVLSGTLSAEDAAFAVPKGRWSYYPAGFFIRYFPTNYRHVRVDIYYPEKFEIRRDASGRIISVSTPDGRRVGPPPPQRPTIQFASRIAGDSRLEILRAAMAREGASAKAALLALAELDYRDLVEVQNTMGPALHPSGVVHAAEPRRFIREAVHAALARYLGIAHRATIARGSQLEVSLRPASTASGFAYVIAPVASAEMESAQSGGGGAGYKPSSGGATAPGPRQRIAPSGKQSSLPSGASGRPPATKPLGKFGNPDPGNKAPDFKKTLSDAASGLGTAASPAGMAGQGMRKAFDAAGEIGGNLSGNPTPPETEMRLGDGHGRSLVGQAMSLAAFHPASWSSRAITARPLVRATQQGTDYKTLSKPRQITFPLVQRSSGLTAEQAQTWNAVLKATFEMAMALEATSIADARLAAAVKAKDMEWQWKQTRALVYLKRAAGAAMVELATNLEELRRALGPGLGVTEDGVREGQRSLAATGFASDASALASQLGRSEAQQETFRRELIALDPRRTGSFMPNTLQDLQNALYEYGSYLALLPKVAPPWN